jgi:hypothetical protein
MTKSYPCPHCNQITIPLWRRLCLGPAWPTTCSTCNKMVGVPWSSMWLALAFGLIGAGLAFLLVGPGRTMSPDSRVVVAIVLLAVLGPLSVVWVRWVPLIKR